MTYYTVFTPFPRKLRAMQGQNRVAFWEFTYMRAGLKLHLYGSSPLHDLNLIQFDNFPDNPFLIRNVIVNIHSHTDIGVSHHILNNLDIQICLRHTSTYGMPQDVSGNMRHLLRLPSFPLCSLPFFLIVGLYNIPQDKIDGAWHHGTSASAHENEIRKAVNLNVTGIPSWKFNRLWVSKSFPTILLMPSCGKQTMNISFILRRSITLKGLIFSWG